MRNYLKVITIKTSEEIEIMAKGGKILAKIMKELKRKVKPGISTKELDKMAETSILESGGKCSFKGYQGFPACLCTSVNEEIVHVAPSDRVLKPDDIISLDLGIFFPLQNFLKNQKRPRDQFLGLKEFPNLREGFHVDMAITVPVGKINPQVSPLIGLTKKALKRGIKKTRPGNTFGDIGNTIQRYVESQGFNVVRNLCGHGIGKELHEDPKILNYGKRNAGPQIKEGMTFCIEPMVTMGNWEIKKSKNGHGYKTRDGSLSCHFEHTLAVTRNGCRILTKLE